MKTKKHMMMMNSHTLFIHRLRWRKRRRVWQTIVRQEHDKEVHDKEEEYDDEYEDKEK